MRYIRSFILTTLISLGGVCQPLRAQPDYWEITHDNGSIFGLVRSLGTRQDSVLTFLRTTSITSWGDSAMVHRYYQPVLTPLDSVRQLRNSKPGYIIEGAGLGVLGGFTLGYLFRGALSKHSELSDIMLLMILGGVAGGITGGVMGIDEVYELDPLTPEERLTLIHGKLHPSMPGDFMIRTIDSTVLVGKEQIEKFDPR